MDRHIFVPVAVETTGVLGPAASTFLTEVARRMSVATGEHRKAAWLRQRVSIAIIRGNAAAVLATTGPVRDKSLRRPEESLHQPSHPTAGVTRGPDL